MQIGVSGTELNRGLALIEELRNEPGPEHQNKLPLAGVNISVSGDNKCITCI